MKNNTINNTAKSVISFLASQKNVEGFSLIPYTYERAEYGMEEDESKVVLDVREEGVEILFRLLNPTGKIVCKTLKSIPLLDEDGNDTGKCKYALAEARVYLHNTDNEDSFVSQAISSAEMDETKPLINVEVSSHTFAKLKALKKLGYGAEYGFDSSLYDSLKEATEITKDNGSDFSSSVIVDEPSPISPLERAFAVKSKFKSTAGMTMKMIYEQFPSFLHYMASDKFDAVLYSEEADAAKLILAEIKKGE